MSASQPDAPGGGRGQAIAALDVLARLADGAVTGVMLVLRGGDATPDVCQIRPTQRVLPALNQVVRAAAGGYADSEVIDYGPAVTAGDGQVMWVSLAGVPLLRAIVAESADLAGLPVFDPGRSPLGHLQLAAMRAAKGDADAVFLQSLRGSQIVARSSRFGVIVRRGVLDVPSSGDILLFNRDVAAIAVGGIALFRNRRAFERLFGYLEELQRQAAATFRSVTSQLRIDGIEQMAAAATGSAAMLGKMASIQRKLDQFPQYRAALTMPRLLAFVRQHPEYQVDTSGSGDDTRLVYRSDAQHRFKILKLLDDDYLRSELTSLEYEANSKSAPL
jgi:hypothetical protein